MIAAIAAAFGSLPAAATAETLRNSDQWNSAQWNHERLMLGRSSANIPGMANAVQAEREWSTRDVADQLLRFNAAVDALERIRPKKRAVLYAMAARDAQSK